MPNPRQMGRWVQAALGVCTKTSKFIYFHIRHLMKILVVILTYHRSHFYLFSLIFT